MRSTGLKHELALGGVQYSCCLSQRSDDKHVICVKRLRETTLTSVVSAAL